MTAKFPNAQHVVCVVELDCVLVPFQLDAVSMAQLNAQFVILALVSSTIAEEMDY